jgi:ADP-ribosylation factor GTPase-activating protein 2/3
MGTHVTFVRSVNMDSWKPEQLQVMKLGGNENAEAFFKANGWSNIRSGKTEDKYASRAAKLYRVHLEREVAAAAAGKSAPDPLSAPTLANQCSVTSTGSPAPLTSAWVDLREERAALDEESAKAWMPALVDVVGADLELTPADVEQLVTKIRVAKRALQEGI